MILGDENVIPEKDKFNSISITVGNSRKLLLNLDSFGFVNVPTPELINALNEQPKTPNFDKAKRPVLAYFNGDCEIFKQDTKLGIISARNSIRHNYFGDASGVKIDNEVIITIEFHDGLYVDEALKQANLVSLFLRFIGGQGLFFNNITMKKVDQDNCEYFVHHDSHEWKSISNGDDYTSPLLDLTSEGFPELLRRWFEKEDRTNVRYSFYDTYFKDVFTSDRLIAAANMFDIFPSTESEPSEAISSDTQKSLEKLLEYIESNFSNNLEIKKQLNSSVGYIAKKPKNRKKALKERIQERLEIIRPELKGLNLKIDELEFVIELGKQARNYYVHGKRPSKLSPEQCTKYKGLFIIAFEYIYALSELVECGWRNKNAPLFDCRHKLRGYEESICFMVRDLKSELI
jgi:hypothetical protein